MNSEELLTKAIERVESKSIREWATSEHNKPIMLKIADSWLSKVPNAKEPYGVPLSSYTDEELVLRFSAWIVCQAIGL